MTLSRLMSMTHTQLKDYCRTNKIKVFKGLTKEHLRNAIIKHHGL